MKNKQLYLLLFIAPLLLSFSVHKYYLSLTQIEFVKEKQSVQIIMNVFIDDIETALNKNHAINLQLNTKKELKENDTYFEKYLTKHFMIKIDGVEKKATYLGKAYEGDNVFLYLEIENISRIKELEIFNSVLVTHFPKQQNLIKAKINGINRSKLLNKRNDKALLKF
jgi:hypothetical protein